MKIDLLIKNVKVYNSYLKKFREANVAILDKKIFHVDIKKEVEFHAEKVIDGKNQYMIPGLIDRHLLPTICC